MRIALRSQFGGRGRRGEERKEGDRFRGKVLAAERDGDEKRGLNEKGMGGRKGSFWEPPSRHTAPVHIGSILDTIYIDHKVPHIYFRFVFFFVGDEDLCTKRFF